MIAPYMKAAGIGNQIWQYVVTRAVAEYNNYDFHIPTEFYGAKFLGTQLFDLDLGVEQDLTTKDFIADNWDMIQAYNPEVFKVEDFTRIHGHVQSERYIIEKKQSVQKWLKLKNENLNLLNYLNLDNNTCIIHVRANDLKLNPECLLPKKYYEDSIRHMKQINPNMKFIVITDDLEFANGYFNSEYPIYMNSMADDFYVLNNAKYLIISSSTFAWWAAWLNDKNFVTIAPKYWLHYNRSSGHWALFDMITNGWFYVDRAGSLFTSNQCWREKTDMIPGHFNGEWGYSVSGPPGPVNTQILY